MGRIKTKLLKRAGEKLYSENKDKFKDKFEDNKKIVDDLMEIPSKKLRNIIAGYVTRLVKKK
ncbi:MAG: 30S ribosomal protein S17e [Nanoarchaeota archaeon]|nr:30S ribosomal protein S17e [Nanoarchaeota archaeon]